MVSPDLAPAGSEAAGIRRAGSWLIPLREPPAAAGTLVCFPNAGAGPASFAPWAKALHEDIAVWAVCLPGREHRVREQPLTDLRQMARELLGPIGGLDGEVSLFGHCGGAVLAYEVAQQLGTSQPHRLKQLIVSAQLGPAAEDPSDQQPVHDLPLPQLLTHLESLGGTPAKLLANEQLMALLLPAIRADLRAIEEYSYDPSQSSLDIPIVALGGQFDQVNLPEAVARWNQSTRDRFSMHLFPGGHLFLTMFAEQVLRTIEYHVRA